MNTRAITAVACLAFTGFALGLNAQEVEGPVVQTKVITLEDAQRMAAENNPSLKNVDEVIYQSDIMIRSAWSMLLPNVSASGSITRNQREVVMEFPDFSTMDPVTGAMDMDEMVIQEKWGKTFGFSANMTLFNPRSIPLIKNAYTSADRTRLQAQVNKNNLLFAVTAVYYQASTLREGIGVVEENLEMAREFLRQANARLEVGQTTKIDVMRAELQVLDLEKQLANTRDGYDEARAAVGYLIGAEGGFELAQPEKVDNTQGDLEELTDKAIEQRLEVKSATLDREMAERSKKETYTKWIPSFDVTYAWNWTSAEGFAGEKDSWMLIFGAKWSLLEGGGRFAELKDRESKIRMADNTREQLIIDVRKEVEESHRDVGKQKRNVDFSDRAVALALENHRMVSKQYEVGMATSLDVLNASTDLASKRVQQVLDQLGFDMAVLSLEQALGEYHSLAHVEKR